MAFDTSGNLYASIYGDNTIVRFTPGGVASVFATTTGGANPDGLAFDRAGNLFVANYGSSRIQKFTPAGVGSISSAK